jgi:hypothetical protein
MGKAVVRMNDLANVKQLREARKKTLKKKKKRVKKVPLYSRPGTFPMGGM